MRLSGGQASNGMIWADSGTNVREMFGTSRGRLISHSARIIANPALIVYSRAAQSVMRARRHVSLGGCDGPTAYLRY